jgi:hypothetical protein
VKDDMNRSPERNSRNLELEKIPCTEINLLQRLVRSYLKVNLYIFLILFFTHSSW